MYVDTNRELLEPFSVTVSMSLSEDLQTLWCTSCRGGSLAGEEQHTNVEKLELLGIERSDSLDNFAVSRAKGHCLWIQYL